jgi:hypothetical protein
VADDIEEGTMHVQTIVVVVNEVQFAEFIVKKLMRERVAPIISASVS